MRRILCLIFSLLFVFSVKAQNFISLSTSGNFDFAVSGLELNEVGIGANVGINLFASRKLQFKIESGVDNFWGDKTGHADSAHHIINDPCRLLNLKAGPEFFFTKNFSVAALYGYATYDGYITSKEAVVKIKTGMLKFQASGHWGKKDRVLTNLYFSSLLGGYHVHFWGVSIGSRIF